jgi:beta-lactamase class A
MRKRVLLLFLFIPAILFTVKVLMDHSQQIKKVAGLSSSRELISPLSSITPAEESRLGEFIKEQLSGTTGSYGVVILNLKTNESFFLNEHTTFKTGSLYKLWVMAATFEQIKAGTLKETDILSQDINVLHNKFGLASPSAQINTQPSDSPIPSGDPNEANKITMSVGEALEKMITISDNYAALLLTERIRLVNLSSFLDNNGFSESMVGIKGGDPITSSYDIALFLKKLYKGELADKEYTDKMLTLLKRQRLNGKLPKYLPKDTVIAHKTGELDEFTHDVGIVYAPSGDYIIVALSESSSRVQAEERISLVSQAVYKYFEK